MSDVEVALEALRSDANTWDLAADNLNQARGIVAPLELTPKDVMSYAAARGFDRRYNDMRAKLDRLLAQGSANFRGIAGSLLEGAEIYEQAEAGHAGRLGKLDGN
ncbi:hypothetical protein MUY14_32400 [Amycolatopsis sp. FBCC-B4732]|uniref:hypothetical protein n=1 Tax=Amycolatopsis sp. FBCC-B4732 TaxID=3079339 RepID=UPI001FF6894D|nr:hypothetical protein [Amycolatopsis sp. FBCC-B4732]UOX86427.1 hypothetical protein MUY14_32400 [Amycolatopsis sp. FBCC-B4732]